MSTRQAATAEAVAPSSLAALRDVLHALRDTAPASGNVLSAILDVSPARWGSKAYLLTFRDGCKAIRPNVPAAEHQDFEQAVAHAEHVLTSMATPTHPGLALYAAPDPHYFFAAALPVRPHESIAWAARPELEPLQRALDESERVAIALVDQARARLFIISLGQIEVQQTFSDDVPGKQATGGWYALAQTRFERHRETQVVRHVRRTIDALLALVRLYPFDRLLIGGPDEAVATLEHHLPRPLRLRLSGRLRVELFAGDAAVVQAALEAAAQTERREELTAVRELVEAASTPHVALGLEPVLAAVSEDRVHRLFLADAIGIIGGACPSCGRLTSNRTRCPVCGAALPAPTDLRETLLERAWRQGARVELVSGAAAAELERFGGVGAWTRH